MSKIEVDTVEPQSGTSLTLGASGDTITIPSGATLDASNATLTLPDDSVTTAKIDDGAVTSAKITYPLTTFSSTGIDDDGTSTAITINSSNNVALAGNIGLGGATPTTSGTGITFPASTSASTNANTLDDYEEGTWTPSDISGASLTLTGPVGNYVKIGKCVIVTYSWRFPSTASGTAINIGNLPFTAASGNDNYQGNVSTTDYGSSDIVIWNNAASTNIRIRNYNDSALSNANLSGKYITGQSIYFI
jgi:hypothetical protein